jgi:hypothetical protein
MKIYTNGINLYLNYYYLDKMSLQSVKGESFNIESTNNSEPTNSSSLRVKCLVQQCTSAKLYTKLAENNCDGEFVQVL